MAKQQLINRNKYKDIKRFDHHQMEMFARSLYEQGVKDGVAKALEKVESGREQMDLHILREKLMETKGIGAVKADAIVEVVRRVGGYE